tara:strand:- start:190 stop:444 length:255 start_codon:yes stop_codon:yes gene_type:complete
MMFSSAFSSIFLLAVSSSSSLVFLATLDPFFFGLASSSSSSSSSFSADFSSFCLYATAFSPISLITSAADEATLPIVSSVDVSI